MYSQHLPKATNLGVSINIGIAALIGFSSAFFGSGFDDGLTTGLLLGIALGLVIQEGLLIQILSREPNEFFQERVLQGDITKSNRRILLFTPLLSLIVLGFILALVSGSSITLVSSIRIISVAAIIMFGVDPLFGLYDRGVLAVFGAAVVYVIILHSGFTGHEDLVASLYPYLGGFTAFSISSFVVAYLLLSTRWTYYKLFCFNEADELNKVVIDTGIPLVTVLLPHFPEFISVLSSIFLG